MQAVILSLSVPPVAGLVGFLPALRIPRLPIALVTAAKKSATDPNPYLAGKAASSLFNSDSMAFTMLAALARASFNSFFLSVVDIAARLPRILQFSTRP